MTRNKIIILALIAITFIFIGIMGVNKEKVKHTEDISDKDFVNKNKIGTYSDIKISNAQVAEKYFKEIYTLILSKDYNKLDLIIDRSEERYKILNAEEIKTEIESKNFMGKELEVVNYKNEKNENWNNIYVFDTKIQDEEIYIKVIIKETSPNVYVVLFE